MIAAVAVAGVLLGTTGCGMFAGDAGERFAGDADTYRFSAGDGVNIEGVGPLSVRNVLVVANEEGTEGNLIAALVNNTDEDQVLRIEVGDGPSPALEITVPAMTTVSYGQRDSLEDPPLIEDLNALPGSTVSMYFQAGDSEGITEEVPVLAGCLGYLEGLSPGDEDSSAECATNP